MIWVSEGGGWQMKPDPQLPPVEQPLLFELGETSTGSLELFPEVWFAAESLGSPEPQVRRDGLNRLIILGAPRHSPLVSYLLATRLADPDIEMRCLTIQALAEVFSLDPSGNPASDQVRRTLGSQLARMRTREIYALIQAAIYDPSIEEAAARLLAVCVFAGRHLVDILSERKIPLIVRRQAVRFVGKVGYVDAIQALERIAARLETRLNGQQALPFLPLTGIDDTELLPEVQEVLFQLRSI
jgi:hypothetical protein